MGVQDPLGLVRCAACGNAFEYDRQPDGRCAICGGWFDPLVGRQVRYRGELPCKEGHAGYHAGFVVGAEPGPDGLILTVQFTCCGPGYTRELPAGTVEP